MTMIEALKCEALRHKTIATVMDDKLIAQDHMEISDHLYSAASILEKIDKNLNGK